MGGEEVVMQLWWQATVVYPMRWWRPTSLWSVREHQNINKGSTYQAALFDKSTANMGRKHAFNDIDFVKPPKYDVLLS